MDSLEDILSRRIVDESERSLVNTLLYGRAIDKLQFSSEARKLSEERKFELAGYRFDAEIETSRTSRIVLNSKISFQGFNYYIKVGAIQNKIVLPTSEAVDNQRNALLARIGTIAEVASLCGVNILCMQEAWHMPFFLCTREKLPWCEFAESAVDGPTVTFCQQMFVQMLVVVEYILQLAAKYNMVIVSPILERSFDDIVWNTAVVINNDGKIVGKTRKNHIPRVGDFNEDCDAL
uniref:CN hydrolase domain-containing protein n=1 Tax=Romanomermis culicivorax TaxID=13658 RepID=A0A915IRY9_ROMCU